MNIVFIIYRANAGGAVLSTTKKQAEYLAMQGDNVYLISNGCPIDWQGVECIEINAIDRFYWKWLDWFLVRSVNMVPVARFRNHFDMLNIIPMWRFPLSAIKVVRKLSSRVKLDCSISCQHFSVTRIKNLEHTFDFPFMLISHGDVFSLPSTAYSFPTMKLYQYAARLSYKNANFLVAVSKALKIQATRMGISNENSQVIQNGIDISDLCGGKELSLQRTKKIELLFVGRLVYQKGVHVLLDALNEIKDLSVHCRIVGAGPVMDDLMAKVKEHGLEDTCEFLGGVPRNSLDSLFRASDIFVMPSLAEGQGLVRLEAAAFGVPVIASDVGGIPELMEDGVDGFLFPPCDHMALAGRIRKLCGDEQLRKSMADKALSRVVECKWPVLLKQFRACVVGLCTNKC